MGPFLKAMGNRRWLLMGIDNFTKWVEVEPLANIRDTDVKRYVWKNIVTQFGVPRVLISDNGLKFDRPFGDIAWIWELSTSILLHLIHKAMVRQRRPTSPL